MDLTAIFWKFAVREVPLIEKPYEIEIEGLDTIEGTQIELADQNDPTLAEMNQIASQNGLNLRVWWPGIMGTMDYRTDRVNAHIKKGDDGKWRVADNFNIG